MKASIQDFPTVDNNDSSRAESENTRLNSAIGERLTFNWKKLWQFTGPGLLMSIAFLDPGNLAGDLQAGISGGYKLLWVLFWGTAAGLLLQILAARLGTVTGKDLAVVCRENLKKPAAVTLWAMIEIAIIASDIQEVVGSAIALNILFGLPLWIGVIITIVDSLTFLGIHYFGVRKLEALFAFLIGTMAVCFCINFFSIAPSFGLLMEGLVVPVIPHNAGNAAIGLIGSIIMPHNIYLHSGLVLSRKIDRNNRPVVKEANMYFAIESTISLFISFLINLFVISTFAYWNFHPGPSQNIDLQEAGDALAQNLGEWAKYVWAVGLLAAGQSATMTGSYAGQFVMNGFLKINLPQYLRVFMTRSIAVVPALLVVFFSNIDGLNVLLNILQAIQLPFALIPIIKFTSSKQIMGEFANGRFLIILCSVLSLIIIAMNFFDIFSDTPNTALVWTGIAIVGSLYIGFLIYVTLVKIVPQHESRSLNVSDIDHNSSNAMLLNKSVKDVCNRLAADMKA